MFGNPEKIPCVRSGRIDGVEADQGVEQVENDRVVVCQIRLDCWAPDLELMWSVRPGWSHRDGKGCDLACFFVTGRQDLVFPFFLHLVDPDHGV